MTASTTRTRVARLPLRDALAWSIAVSIAVTALLMTVLAIRMAQGRDAALGPKLAGDSPAARATPSTLVQPSPGTLAAAPPAQPVQTTTS